MTGRRLIWVLAFLLASCAGIYTIITDRSSVGAQGADVLRGWIGDPAVAWLEGAVFQLQDAFLQVGYRLGVRPDSPWDGATPVMTTLSMEMVPTVRPTADTPKSASETPAAISNNRPSCTLTATPSRWPPKNLTAFGSMEGEGVWSAYLYNAQGRAVAYRTFLQPDASRPYALAAVVAVDFETVRLEYVPGFEEPYTDVAIKRPGPIPKEDKQPGILLATFNGGFLMRHGRFGVMVEGEILVPMVDGLGTLAIYPDGRVRIGVWGEDMTSVEGIETIRQNGPVIIHDGRINPQAFQDSLELWGASLSGEMATWRSAVGISADGKTLYYVAGWSLDMPALARTLQSAGSDAAIQLDINRYWVLFAAILFDSEGSRAVPLLEEMNENVDRYLKAYSRDYFYLASILP